MIKLNQSIDSVWSIYSFFCLFSILKGLRPMLFYIFVIVSKSHKKTKTNHAFWCPQHRPISSYWTRTSKNGSQIYGLILKKVSDFPKKLGTVVFRKCNWNIGDNWGLFSAVDESLFGALVNIWVHIQYLLRSFHSWLGIFIGFVHKKKNTEDHQTYLLTLLNHCSCGKPTFTYIAL